MADPIAAAVASAAPASATTVAAPAAPAPATTAAATPPSPAAPSNILAEAKPDAGAPVIPAPEVPAVPTDYSTLKFPDNIQVDNAQFDQFKTIAAENKIPPEAAQKLLDLYTADFKKFAVDAPREAWNTLQTQWQNDLRADPEIGGDKTGPITANIAKVIDQVMETPEAALKLRQAFITTGAGNNPEIVRFLSRMSSVMNEGGFVNGNGATPDGQAIRQSKSIANILYPNQGVSS